MTRYHKCPYISAISTDALTTKMPDQFLIRPSLFLSTVLIIWWTSAWEGRPGRLLSTNLISSAGMLPTDNSLNHFFARYVLYRIINEVESSIHWC